MKKKPLILVADDDRGSRLIIKKTMEQNGYEVIEVENGWKALDALEAMRPDLVVLDLLMPQTDGFTACQHIRADPNGMAIPIIIITGKDDFDSISKAYYLGATDFIFKPINQRILSERVRYALGASSTFRQLQAKQQILARMQTVARLGNFFFEPDSSYLTASKEFHNILGFAESPQTIAWKDFWQRIHPDDRQSVESLIQKARSAGACFPQDVRIIDDKQRERFARLQLDSETDSDGDIVQFVGIIQDITEQKLSELLETDQKNILRRIVEKEPLEKVFIEAASLLERQRPNSIGVICQVEGNRIHKIVAPNMPVKFRESITGTVLYKENGICAAAAYLGQQIVVKDVATSFFWERHRTKALAHGIRSSAAVPIFSGAGQVMGTVAMIQKEIYHATNADLDLMKQVANILALAIEQYQLSQHVIYQTQHDLLTGLVNKGTMEFRLSQSLKEYRDNKGPGAYLLINIDRFKQINDSMGTRAGDALLQQVGQRLRQCARKNDLAGRVERDEFALLMPDLHDKNNAVQTATRILESLNSGFTIEGQKIDVQASIGITLFPRDAGDSPALHRNAGIAMYVAKNRGGNQFVFFDNKMQETVIQHLEIENDLRKSLERNEFELHYQPQLDLASYKVVGMEALIRWNHPEKGQIPATPFLQVAEESGLIIPIGRWVLKEACRQNAEWQKQGFLPSCVMVNVSITQFTNTDFISTVQEALYETGLDPEWLEVEVTESLLLNNFDKACKNLQKLKEIGVKITLEGFALGYASIDYLRRVPLDSIKVDQSLIRDMESDLTAENSGSQNSVKMFAKLAHSLQLHLSAIGIETENQVEMLKEIGYTKGQGFFFSPPLPADEAGKHLLTSSPA